MTPANPSGGSAASMLAELQRKQRLRKRQRRVISIVLLGVALSVGIRYYVDTQRKLRFLDPRVTYLNGKGTITDREGNVADAEVGTSVPVGATVVTEKDAEIDIGLGSFGGLKIDGDSKLEIESLYRKGDYLESGLKLEKGRVFNKLKKLGSGSEFRLKAPSSQIIVRGTEFFVEANGDGSLVAVRTGTVEAVAEAKSSMRRIGPGKMARITQGGVGTVEDVGDRERRLFRELDRIIEVAGVSNDPVSEQWISLLSSTASTLEGWEVIDEGGSALPKIANGKVTIKPGKKDAGVRMMRKIGKARDVVVGGTYLFGQQEAGVMIYLETADGELLHAWVRNGGYWGFGSGQGGEDSTRLKKRINFSRGYHPVSQAGLQEDDEGFVLLQVAKLGPSLALYAGGMLLAEARLEGNPTIVAAGFKYRQFADEPVATEFRDWRIYYPADSEGQLGELEEVDYWRICRRIAYAENRTERLAALRSAVTHQRWRREFWFMLARELEEAGSLRGAAVIYRGLAGGWTISRNPIHGVHEQIARERFRKIVEGSLIPAAYKASPPTVFIAKGAAWRFHDGADPPPETWIAPGFDDSSWKSGNAVLGYGEEMGLATELDFGDDPDNKPPVCYFRHAFEKGDGTAVKELFLSLRRDDGAVIFLNGREILRSNMHGESLQSDTLAARSAGDDEEEIRYHSLFAPTDALVDGRNVVAVSVHQAAPDSSDLAFDLQFEGVGELLLGGEGELELPESVLDALDG